MAYGEDHAVALSKWHHVGPRLHPRPLLDQHELGCVGGCAHASTMAFREITITPTLAVEFGVKASQF